MVKKYLSSEHNKALEWQKEARSYFGNTPKPKNWFEFLEWITALATLDFLSQETGSIFIKLLYFASYAVLYNYLQKTIYTHEFQRYIPKKLFFLSIGAQTYLVAAVLVIFAYMFIFRVTNDITSSLLAG